MPLFAVFDADAYAQSFSAPKGVERACPPDSVSVRSLARQGFSAPKGVERACPARPPKIQTWPSALFQCPEGR